MKKRVEKDKGSIEGSKKVPDKEVDEFIKVAQEKTKTKVQEQGEAHLTERMSATSNSTHGIGARSNWTLPFHFLLET